MGLAATREIAQELLYHLGASGRRLTWALSGCPNSCSQSQLADVGIVAARLTADQDGIKTPRFDIYRRSGEGLGARISEGLTRDELYQAAGTIG